MRPVEVGAVVLPVLPSAGFLANVCPVFSSSYCACAWRFTLE